MYLPRSAIHYFGLDMGEMNTHPTTPEQRQGSMPAHVLRAPHRQTTEVAD